jgi:hypothetical protein
LTLTTIFIVLLTFHWVSAPPSFIIHNYPLSLQDELRAMHCKIFGGGARF